MVLATQRNPNTPLTEEEEQQYEAQFVKNDPTGLVKEIEVKTKIGLTATRKWDEEAKEDFKFALGNQYTQEELDKLKQQGRPALTFNKIRPLLNLVSGYERENSMRIRIFPEGGEDRVFSEIGDRCMKAIDKWTKLNYKLNHVFDDGIICGKGWIEMGISYEEDIVNGDLIFRHLSPFQVVRDPEGKEYDQSDWKWMVKLTPKSKSALKEMFPEKTDIINSFKTDTTDYLSYRGVLKEGDADNYHLGKEEDHDEDYDLAFLDPYSEKKDTYILKEYWHKKKVKKFCMVNIPENKIEKFDTKEDAEKRIKEINTQRKVEFESAMKGWEVLNARAVQTGQQVPAKPVHEELDIKIYERNMTEMWYSAACAGYLMQEDSISPLAPYYNGFPIFNYFAEWTPSALKEELRIKGITRDIKDPNREINKSRSQFLHILNTSANSGWVGDEDALTPEGWEDLKRLGSAAGITIKKKKDSYLERIQPVAPSIAQQMRGEQGQQDIKDISGINADALAIQDKTVSGRAIGLRIKQAMTILAPYFTNFRYTKEMIGNAIFAMLPHIFNKEEIMKLLGEEFIKTNTLTPGYIDAFLLQVEDGKYDVTITEADNSATIRQETFEQLMEMAKQGMPVPPDVILQFSNIPNQKEIVEKINAYAERQAQNNTGKPK